jgi:hypothetical protein
MRLARERRADEFRWSFIALNALGIALLALRSAELGEAGFLAVNVLTAGFWAFAGAIKAHGALAGKRSIPAAIEA